MAGDGARAGGAPPVGGGRITVAATYNESSALSIARAAATTGRLVALVTPEVPPPGLEAALARASGRAAGVAAAVARRAAVAREGLPVGTARPRLFAAHAVMQLAWRAGLRGHAVEGLLKAFFDAAVARDLARDARSPGGPGPGDVFVGMPGSSLRSFRVARALGMLAVLDQVNCDLDDLNAAVAAAAARTGVRPGAPWPTWVVARVARELALADRVIISSDHGRDRLAARGVDPARVLILPYGVDATRFTPAPPGQDPVPRAAGLRVLFVGIVALSKGVHDLDAAVSLAGDAVARCDAFGGVVDPGLRSRATRVTFRGLTDPAGIAAAMREADVFVLPTLGDTLPRAVLEALASGLPVITTREAGCDRVIVEGKTGFLVPAADPPALAAALTTLAADPARRAAMGVAARRVAETYTWARHGATFLDWLAGVAEGAAGGGAGVVGPGQLARARTTR